METRLIMAIALKYTQMLNHCVAFLKLIFYVNYISINETLYNMPKQRYHT